MMKKRDFNFLLFSKFDGSFQCALLPLIIKANDNDPKKVVTTA